MLDKLPTELLIRILELAAPLHYDPDHDFERQSILLDCCLVSRTLCALAQPKLPEVFELERLGHLELLEEVVNGRKRGSRVKILLLESLWGVNRDRTAYGPILTYPQLVDLTPALVELRIVIGGDVDLSVFAKLPSLRSLIISDVHLLPFSDPDAVFPQLVELYLGEVTTQDGVLTSVPSARVTPRLKAFAARARDNLQLRASSWPTLEILQLEKINFPDHGKSTTLQNTLRVVQQDLERIAENLSNLPSSLRIYLKEADLVPLDNATQEYAFDLRDLHDLLLMLPAKPSSTSLRHLSLPLPLSRAPSLGSLLAAVVETCQKKGVEVYYDEKLQWGYESMVSPALWRRARELRREKSGGLRELEG